MSDSLQKQLTELKALLEEMASTQKDVATKKVGDTVDLLGEEVRARPVLALSVAALAGFAVAILWPRR